MNTQFKDQGGAATMDPSAFKRFLTSHIIRRLCSEERLTRLRAKAEKARQKQGSPHVVEYFHQVEDGYSHLAAQMLARLAERYDIQLQCHLVRGPGGKNVPEPELLLALSRYDSAKVAPHYGLDFPDGSGAPEPALVDLARGILANCEAQDFASLAPAVGTAMWAGDKEVLETLAEKHGRAEDKTVERRLEEGSNRRAELKHYSGGMFYYAGEWYWGVDRLYHLEKRLKSLGADRVGAPELLVPRPAIEAGELRDDGSLTFEVYPSLRSPYTSIIFDKAVELARQTGVKLVVRPVLPMVMRGVPATREKGFYIFSDTAREARELGLNWGKSYDPIGEPVRRCYSLYRWACEQGRGIELLSSFLNAAFSEGINTNNDRGLRHVVEKAGLSWQGAQDHIGKSGWEEELERNRLAMYDFGSWGVPSFRLLDVDGSEVLALWGQDRLWLFAREIQRLLKERASD